MPIHTAILRPAADHPPLCTPILHSQLVLAHIRTPLLCVCVCDSFRAVSLRPSLPYPDYHSLPIPTCPQIRTLCVSPDGTLLLSIDEDGRALLINKVWRNVWLCGMRKEGSTGRGRGKGGRKQGEDGDTAVPLCPPRSPSTPISPLCPSAPFITRLGPSPLPSRLNPSPPRSLPSGSWCFAAPLLIQGPRRCRQVLARWTLSRCWRRETGAGVDRGVCVCGGGLVQV